MYNDPNNLPEQTESQKTPRISRRAFIIGSGFAIVGVSLAGIFILQPTLKALVDTIVPADEFGPAASETGAVEYILAASRGRMSSHIRLRVAIAWLNWRAGGSFALASLQSRTRILTEMALSPHSSYQRRFYDKVRDRTMRHYYGSAARAKALGFAGAPQPEGYPGASLPWDQRK